MAKRTQEFKIQRKNKRSRVNSETEPTIMSMKGKFDVTPTELVSQKHFFNMKNRENEYKHISPWHFPFVQNLMQQKPVINFDMNNFGKVGRYRDSIEGVTRKYEERFLTEPSGKQRKCVNEEACEGLCASENGFILREFLLPSQEQTYNATKRYPQQREPCLMCKRLRIAKTVVATRASGNGLQEDCLIQDYYNFVGLEGEYRLEDCLLSKRNTWEGLCNPVVLHQRNNYRIVVVNKVKQYEQWRYPFFCQLPGETPGTTNYTTHFTTSDNN